MNLLDPVKNIMTQEVETIEPSSSLFLAKKKFEKFGFHHLPVQENGALVGMLSVSDILLFQRGFHKTEEEEELEKLRLKTTKVSDIMTTGIATLEPQDKINIALEVFKKNIFHALPIVDEDRLVGIVSTFDIIAHLAADKGATNKYK